MMLKGMKREKGGETWWDPFWQWGIWGRKGDRTWACDLVEGWGCGEAESTPCKASTHHFGWIRTSCGRCSPSSLVSAVMDWSLILQRTAFFLSFSISFYTLLLLYYFFAALVPDPIYIIRDLTLAVPSNCTYQGLKLVFWEKRKRAKAVTKR